MFFQILDIDYTVVNEKPVVRIFGKDENGVPVCCFHEGFMPYFYVLGDVAANDLKGEQEVVKTERVERLLPAGYQQKKSLLTKITLKNPAKTPEIRERLVEKGYRAFEADIPFKYRFMADFGLKGMDWIEMEGNSVNTGTVSVEKKVKADSIKRVERAGIIPLKTMALDIECIANVAGNVPDAKRDPVIIISLCFSHPYKGKNSIVMSTRSGSGVQFFESEKEMLEGLIDLIMDYDPDIITGFNINNFDMPYLLERMRQREVAPVFGRSKKSVRENKLQTRFRINITGRVIVDTYEIVKKDFSLKRYDLNTVSRELLGEAKLDVKYSEMTKLWKGSSEGFARLTEYAEKDAMLALSLLMRLSLLDKYIALARLTPTLLQDVLDSGETVRIENLLLHEFNREGFVIPCKPSRKEAMDREEVRIKELKGGFVLDPKRGLHSSVIVLDFKSMYPSLIRTYNICPTTLLLNGSDLDFYTAPSGGRFLKETVRKGIVPRILQNLMEQRQDVKKLLKKEHDKNKIRELNARQWGLKILSNAFYGNFGYPRSKVYSLEIANAITAWGREMIKKTKEYVETTLGYEVVYGDTDSVMIKVPESDLDKIRVLGENISKDMNSRMEGVMSLEFEKIFMRFLPLTKKRYAAWAFEPGPDGWKDRIETKGIETVRRDWCNLVSETVGSVLETILKENNTKKAVACFRCVVQDVVDKKVDISKLVITKTLTKKPDVSKEKGGYDGIQPHAELVKKMKRRNAAEAPGVGDRISYVITKGLDMLSKRAEDPSYVIERGIEIDPKYYIENQLLPPLERIFDALGISKTELLGKGKQANLFAMMNSNSHEQKVVEELPAGEVDGFICPKCHRDYTLPPLKGTCECGEALLFSSRKGPVKAVIFNG